MKIKYIIGAFIALVVVAIAVVKVNASTKNKTEAKPLSGNVIENPDEPSIKE